MSTQEQLQKLAAVTGIPCVSISMPTHRTHPDNLKDIILLKHLCKDAEVQLIERFGKRAVQDLLQKLQEVPDMIDPNYNLDSLHIFVAADTLEIVRSPWDTSYTGTQVSDQFALRPLIKGFNRSVEYLILLLSQSGVHLYHAQNDHILHEIHNPDFPFKENRFYNTHSDKGSDPKHLDDLVREFLNRVDKALVRVHNELGLEVVAIATTDNYIRLQQVADKPAIYLGMSSIDYNHISRHHIAAQAWTIVDESAYDRRQKAFNEILEAVSKGNVLTDLQEIYRAAIDGRGELLIVDESYTQPVRFTDSRSFDLVTEHTEDRIVDDITSVIAWQIIAHKGRVVFQDRDEVRNMGGIVLKTRY
ncbi:MAG: hypothetical protein H6606_05875 [Flavobacteriales bacterium]|nr:hypothetical protein [Flavobacteriales bacterium]